MESSFRSLAAYERSVRLSDDLYAAVGTWRSRDLWSLGIQLLRAVDSIRANIAEAVGRTSEADRRKFFVIARGSLLETEHWIVRAEARGLLPNGYVDRLDDISRPLSGLIKRPKRNPQ
jgi:four helix bundle protein